MIFSSKQRRGSRPQRTPTIESCVSIVGLFLAGGVIGGLGALIYGLVRHRPTGIIGGSVALAVSVTSIVVLVLVIMFCFENNHVDSSTNEQHSSTGGNQLERHRQLKQHERTNAHGVKGAPGVHKLEHEQQQKQSSRYDKNRLSPFNLPDQIVDTTNKHHGK